MGALWATNDLLSLARMNQKTIFMGTSAPSTTYAGQLWYNTQSECMEVRNAANGAWIFMHSTLTQITTPVTAGYNATTTLMSYTFGANSLQVGQTIEIEAWCNMVTAASSTTFTIRIWWNSASTILLSTGAVTPTVSLTGDLVHIKAIITVITTTSVEAQGHVWMNPSTAQTSPLRDYAMNSAGTAGTIPNTGTIGSLSTASSAVTLDVVIGNQSGNSLTIRAGYIRIM